MPLQAVLAIVVSAAAWYFSTGFGEVWPLAWIAPIPVLWFALRAPSWRQAAFVAGIAYLAGSLNLLSYIMSLMPLPIVAIVFLAPALIFAISALFARWAARRWPPWIAAFAFPAAWTSYEYLMSITSPHGAGGSIAYSQTDFLTILQLASITGIWGITFVLCLVPSAIAVALSCRAPKALIPAAAAMLVALSFGAIRLRQPPEGTTVRVGLAATDTGIGRAFRTKDQAIAVATAHEYAARVASLVTQGAQVVVLPEKFVGVTPSDSSEVMSAFSNPQAIVIAGFNRIGIDPPRNVADVFAPDGRLLLEYDKRHMLPGPETGYRVGKTPGLFNAPGGQWGVAICKDMDFQAWSREYGKRGVRFLAVPAWDFNRDAKYHLRPAIVRAVENGFTMARVAQEGFLNFSDAYGRILAQERSSELPAAMMLRDIHPGPGPTFYTRTGDWFGRINVVLLIVVLAMAPSKLATRS
ncbi:MAG: nitrilase-related carbon-nitrogen hydrolase [Bryobacteraceae bacterium]